MADLEQIVVSIDAKIDGLLDGMKDAEKQTKKSTKSMGEDLADLTDDFRKGADAAVKWGAAAVAAGAAAAAAIVAATSEQVNALDRASRRLGVNVEVLSAYAQAAKAAGLDQDEFTDALQQTNIQIADFVQTGGGGAFDLITQLGLDARALNELKPDQQILALAEAIKDVPESAALKFLDDIGSDSLAALLPLLKDGGEAFKAMADEALNAGRVIRQEDVEAIRLMDAELKKAQGDTQALAAEFTGTLAPFIIVASKELQELTGEGAEFEDIIETAFKTASTVIGTFANGVQGIEIIFSALQLGVAEFNALLISGLSEADKGITELLNAVTPDEIAVFKESDFLSGFADSARKEADKLKVDIDALLAEPLSSGAVDDFADDFLAKVEKIRDGIREKAAEGGDDPVTIPIVPEIAQGLDTLDTEDVSFFSDEKVKEAVVQLQLLNKEFADSQQTQLALLTERHDLESAVLNEARERDKISVEDFEIAKADIEQRFTDQKIELAATERERLLEDHEIELEQLRQFLEQKLITEEEFLRRKAQQEKKFNKNNIKLAQEEAKQKSFFGKESTGNLIAGLESLGQVNEKAAKAAFKVNQAKALSDTIVSTAAGIQRAFADLPFPASIAAAAAVAASGIAQVATISSQSFGGGGSPSSSATAAPVGDTAPSTPGAEGADEGITAEVSVGTTGGGPTQQTLFVNVGGDDFGDVLVDALNKANVDGRGQGDDT